MSGTGRRIGAVADWATLHRPRWPVIETRHGHPGWVARALDDCLPLVVPCVGVALLQLLDRTWAWLASAIAYGSYLAVFALLPWLVSIARSFTAGYLGDEQSASRGTQPLQRLDDGR